MGQRRLLNSGANEYRSLTAVELIDKWEGKLKDDRTIGDVLFEAETENCKGKGPEAEETFNDGVNPPSR